MVFVNFAEIYKRLINLYTFSHEYNFLENVSFKSKSNTGSKFIS